jgi:hypothetical protein
MAKMDGCVGGGGWRMDGGHSITSASASGWGGRAAVAPILGAFKVIGE